MPDITDPVVLSTIVQAAVVTLTLVVFILSFRSQNKAIQEQAYQKALDDYGDIMKMMAEKPELYRFQTELFDIVGRDRGVEQQRVSREDMIIRNHVLLMYGFFERLYALYRRKWIDEDTWKQWAAFLELMTNHPVFKNVHETSKEMWDKPFVDYVTDVLNRKT